MVQAPHAQARSTQKPTEQIIHVAKTCAGLVYWARGRDPILKRYAVGSLARALTASSQDYERVKGTGGLSALAHSCSCPDGQTQCYAAGAIGAHSAESCMHKSSLNVHHAALEFGRGVSMGGAGDPSCPMAHRRGAKGGRNTETWTRQDPGHPAEAPTCCPDFRRRAETQSSSSSSAAGMDKVGCVLFLRLESWSRLTGPGWEAVCLYHTAGSVALAAHLCPLLYHATLSKPGMIWVRQQLCQQQTCARPSVLLLIHP